MTRINTNVSSLVAQNTLGRSNASLNQALTRLSTGLRINTGKDDPAGLIASENLRSDITAIRKAISNTDRANQVIATADSALGQVSSLLNDIRGLVTESANSGALSDEQISANQLQVDSSLEALNRIAQTTTFQGRRLLDGSLDFITSAGGNYSQLSSLEIDQANLGATGQVGVEVNVTTAATQATVTVDSLPDVTPTTAASVDFDIVTTPGVGSSVSGVSFTAITADTAQGAGTLSTTAIGTLDIAGETITITADAAGAAANGAITSVVVNDGAGPDSSTLVGGVLTLNIAATLGAGATVADLVSAIDAGADGTGGNGDDIYTASTTGGATAIAAADVTATNTGNTFTDIAGGGSITLTAIEDNLADGAEGVGAKNITVNFGAGQNDATYTAGTDTLVVNVTAASGTATLNDILTSITNGADGASTGGDNDFNAVLATGTGTHAVRTGFAPATVTLAGGTDATTTAVTIDIQALASEGTNGDIDIDFVEAALGAGSPAAVVIGDATNGYTLQVNSDKAGGVTIEQVETALESISEIDTVTITAGALSTFNAFDVASINELPAATVSLVNGVDEVVTTETIDLVTALGVTGNIDIDFAEVNLSGAGTNIVDNGVVGGAQSYTLQIDNSVGVSISSIRAALEGITEIGTASIASGSPGTSTYTAANDAPPSTLSIVGAGSASATTGIDSDLVFELAGATGSEVLSFGSGTSLQLLIDGVNAVSDATGVTAEANVDDTGIVFTSSNYGTDAYVDIEIIEEASTGAFTAELDQGTRVNGTDIVASVNGITATGDGNQLSINTATLDLSATVTAGFVGAVAFDITGGGALFQLGPDVVSNQQARLGITSVNTAALGGVSGKLYQLGTGGSADLSSGSLDTAASIVEEAIDQVTSLRGRLGAFQRTTLETNKQALNDTLVNLTEAESTIRDADFSSETAALTRAQILVQSGTTVLQIANQNPQNVLALLRG